MRSCAGDKTASLFTADFNQTRLNKLNDGIDNINILQRSRKKQRRQLTRKKDIYYNNIQQLINGTPQSFVHKNTSTKFFY